MEQPPHKDVVAEIFPLPHESGSETDIEQQLREARRRTRIPEQRWFSRQRRQFHARQFEYETELHLATLFEGPLSGREGASTSGSESPDDSSDPNSDGPHGAEGFDVTAEDGSDWDNTEQAGSQQVNRSFLGQSLVDAKSEVKRLLLLAVLQIKVESPTITPEVAWQTLVIWLKRDRVVERDSEVTIAWVFAFNEPAQAHFRSVFESFCPISCNRTAYMVEALQ